MIFQVNAPWVFRVATSVLPSRSGIFEAVPCFCPRTVVRVCRHPHPGFRLTFLDSLPTRPDPTGIPHQTMPKGTHFRFISRETTNKVRSGYRVLTQIRSYDSRNQLEKKLGWGRTIVADRLSSTYGQLALWKGSMEETPGAALRLVII